MVGICGVAMYVAAFTCSPMYLRRFFVENGTRLLPVWFYNLRTYHNNLTMRVNLVLPLIRWSIIFVFGSRGPASRICIIKRLLSWPSMCYIWKICNVHECELTSINQRRRELQWWLVSQCICDNVEMICYWNWNSYSRRLNQRSSTCDDSQQ